MADVDPKEIPVLDEIIESDLDSDEEDLVVVTADAAALDDELDHLFVSPAGSVAADDELPDPVTLTDDTGSDYVVSDDAAPGDTVYDAQTADDDAATEATPTTTEQPGLPAEQALYRPEPVSLTDPEATPDEGTTHEPDAIEPLPSQVEATAVQAAQEPAREPVHEPIDEPVAEPVGEQTQPPMPAAATTAVDSDSEQAAGRQTGGRATIPSPSLDDRSILELTDRVVERLVPQIEQYLHYIVRKALEEEAAQEREHNENSEPD